MRGRNVSSFVAQNCPGSESKLYQNADEPGGGKSAQRRNFLPVRRNEEPDHSNNDKHSAKTMRHLQPDLRGGDVRYRDGVARGVNFGDCGCAWVGKQLDISGREIGDGKAARLTPPCLVTR